MNSTDAIMQHLYVIAVTTLYRCNQIWFSVNNLGGFQSTIIKELNWNPYYQWVALYCDKMVMKRLL